MTYSEQDERRREIAEARSREFARLVAHHLTAHAKGKMSARALAKTIGLHPVTLSNYARGKSHGTITTSMLLTGAEAIGADPELIVARAHEDLVRLMGPAPASALLAVRADRAPSATPPRPGASPRTKSDQQETSRPE